MPHKINRARKIYRIHGFTTLCQRSVRFLRRRSTELVRESAEWGYQRLKPSKRTFRVDNTIATFDTTPLSLTEYDFSDDLKKEADFIAHFIDNLNDEDVVYDIGANVGLYTCFAAAHHPQPELIVSFEPYPEAANHLRRNASLNSGQIQIKEVALSDAVGTAVLQVHPPTGHVLQKSGDDGVPIEMNTGDEFVQGGCAPPPTVVKIDVEGGEIAVLDGLQKTLDSEYCRHVYCEVHPEKAPQANPEKIARERLEAAGFAVSTLQTGELQTYLHAKRE